MLEWITENWLSVVLTAAVLLAVGFAIGSIVRKKRAGGSSCGCGCGGCPMSGSCRKNSRNEKS